VTTTVLCIFQIALPTRVPRPLLLHVHVCGEELEVQRGFWSTVFAPLSFIGFLLFWQRLRSSAGLYIRTLFVDKCCVDQVNEQRKSKAILSLAGFLRHSDFLVICWTPSYFSRLWTIFEMASWAHLHKLLTSIVFQPVAQASLCIVGMLLITIHNLLRLKQVLPTDVMTFGMVGLWGLAARKQITDLCQIRRQLTDFSVSEAQCFCCTHSHVMPSTGQRLPCDRELVYQTLVERHELTIAHHEVSNLTPGPGTLKRWSSLTGMCRRHSPP